jgi:hypothetical protein
VSVEVVRGPKHSTVLDNVRHGCEAPIFLDFDIGVDAASQIGSSRRNLLNIRAGVLQRQTGQHGKNCPINNLSCKVLSLLKGPSTFLDRTSTEGNHKMFVH